RVRGLLYFRACKYKPRTPFIMPELSSLPDSKQRPGMATGGTQKDSDSGFAADEDFGGRAFAQDFGQGEVQGIEQGTVDVTERFEIGGGKGGEEPQTLEESGASVHWVVHEDEDRGAADNFETVLAEQVGNEL